LREAGYPLPQWSRRLTVNQSALSFRPPRHAAVSDREIRAMALVLRRKFGAQALEVAHGFAAEHRAIGDFSRALIWDGVCAALGPARTLS